MQKVLIVDPDKCTGCRICEMYCSLHKTNTCNPSRSRVNVIKWEEENIMVPVMCQHCQEPVCALVCPVNAIRRDRETGLVATDPNLCVHCHMCIVACPFGGPSLDPVEDKVIRCNLCQDEEGGSICAQVCPTGAITFVRADRVGMKKKREAVKKLADVIRKQGLAALTGETKNKLV